MKLLLSSLLIASMCARSSWGVSSGINVVTQSPTDVSVTEGENVTITCCWTMKLERFRVLWLKNQTDMNQTIIGNEVFNVKNHSEGSLQKDTPDCSNLTLTNVTREDSGIYICGVTVEVPFFTKVEGNGTVITVIASDKTPDNNSGGPHSVLIYVLRCLPLLALIITFFCINTLVTRAQEHTPAAPGNKLTSAQRVEENHEEQERDERETGV